MNLMWKTYRKKVEDDSKFVDNVNDVIICIICCVVEHWLGILCGSDVYAHFDNRSRGNTQYDIPDIQVLIDESREVSRNPTYVFHIYTQIERTCHPELADVPQ